MKTLTIPAKMSGTGTIHDLASQHGPREIKFPRGSKYAVVLAAYYGGRGYTTHRSKLATIEADQRCKDYSRQILGKDGWAYSVEVGGRGELVLVKSHKTHYKFE